MPAPLPRVLLVDDDLAVVMFVRAALRGLEIELLTGSSVAEALDHLHQTPVQLLITDVMLPGESGLGLVERLRDRPELLGSAPIVVTSAALDAAGIQQRLSQLRIWRTLGKPLSIEALEACVRDAIHAPQAAQAAQAEPMPTVHRRTAAVAETPSRAATVPAVSVPADAAATPEHAAAIAEFFAGDAQLIHAYRQACMQRFDDDIAAGDAAQARQDLPALLRLAHNLKSVLTSLGEAPAARAAATLEARLLAGDAGQLPAQWQALRTALLALAQTTRRT